MKRPIICLLIILTSLQLSAQNWLTDFEQAKELAAKESKLVIMVFQGSDWCAPCIKLDREIWSTDNFKAHAEEHFIMLKVDFPKKKQNRLEENQQAHNNQLAESYNKNGYFPLVVVLDSNGKVIGNTGYKKVSPEEFIATLESFKS